MAGLSDFACDGTLVIGGISMNRSAWMIGADEDGEGGLFQLITEVEQRGDDRILPTAVGVIPYRRRITRTPHSLRLVVVGDVDETGVDVADHSAGLDSNLDYLITNVVAPVASTTGTRAATYTTVGGRALTADIHVTGMRQKSYALGQNAIWIGELLISVPAGAFT